MAASELLLVTAIITLVAVLCLWRERVRPKYLVTLQKQTNTTRQPETVTIQANLPGSSSATDVWREIEKAGLAATSRMESINQDILDEMAEESAEIAKRRAEVTTEREQHRIERTRRKLARRLGKNVTEVTDEEVTAAMSRAQLEVAAPQQPDVAGG